MIPKEKADELLCKYINQWFAFGDYLSIAKAKQCALIAVDEIIDATSIKYEYNSDFELRITGKKPLQYWLDVKKEITSL